MLRSDVRTQELTQSESSVGKQASVLNSLLRRACLQFFELPTSLLKHPAFKKRCLEIPERSRVPARCGMRELIIELPHFLRE